MSGWCIMYMHIVCWEKAHHKCVFQFWLSLIILPWRNLRFFLIKVWFEPDHLWLELNCWSIVQSCLTLCNPVDGSPPSSSIHGILQARILEWVAIPFSRGSSWPRNQTGVSCIAGRFFTSWVTRKAQYIPYSVYNIWRKKRQPAPVLLPGKSHGRRSLVGYHPRGCKESNMT